MKKSFVRLWKRNLAFFKLAILSQLEYRVNYFVDAIVQPSITSCIEMLLWISLFSTGVQTIGGFSKTEYLSYVIWASFIARITVSWMYEFKMLEEIESGSINSILVRPMSFFEYYLSQLLGYKAITTFISLLVPISVVLIFDLPTDFKKLPLVILLALYYLIFIHCLGFFISTFAFYLTKIHSFIVAKNLALWLLSGELIPLDLAPEPYRTWLYNLPFANAVYIPAGYLAGRVDEKLLFHGFTTVTYSIAIMLVINHFAWRLGIRKYVGTGA